MVKIANRQEMEKLHELNGTHPGPGYQFSANALPGKYALDYDLEIPEAYNSDCEVIPGYHSFWCKEKSNG